MAAGPAFDQTTTTKALQPALAAGVQNLRDSGRTTVCLTLDAFATAATAETLMTLTKSANGAATSTGSSFTITSGKRFRLQSYVYTAENGGSTPVLSRLKVRIRVNTAGATTTASPIQHLVATSVAATAKSMATVAGEFPECMEYAGDGTATFGVTVESPEFVTTTQLPVAHLTIIGYEY